MKKSIFLLAILILFSLKVEAKYTKTCIARYKTQNGWSKNYTVDVTFFTGSELNEAVNTYRFSFYSVYAVIFWDDDKTTVIKISNYLSCGTVVDKNCITGTFGDIKGKDQDNDEWKICVSDYCY